MGASPEGTKLQANFKIGQDMYNIYANSIDEFVLLLEAFEEEGIPAVYSVQAKLSAAHAVASPPPPAAAGQALPQPVQQAAASQEGHLCDCGQPMRLRSSSFGQFYSCAKPMSDTTRCKKKINA